MTKGHGIEYGWKLEDGINFGKQIGPFGLQQALAGEIVASPQDRQAIARILNKLQQSPSAQLALRHAPRNE